MSANYRLIGVEDIRKSLYKLPKDLQRAAESATLRAGAKPLVREVKAKAPKDSGLLKKSIGYRVRKVKGIINARIGPRNGFRQEVPRIGPDGQTQMVISDPTRYSHLVELGTSRMPAQPFIHPAIDSAKGQVFAAMLKGYQIHLEKTIKRVRSKR
jgi:HK97 gp10 family phage protein